MTDDPLRVALWGCNPRGETVHCWSLSPTRLTDAVQCPLPPQAVLPVIFVPGIMGSNLKSIPQPPDENPPAWRLDAGFVGQNFALLKKWGGQSADKRQNLLHPNRVEVDNKGAVPIEEHGSVRLEPGGTDEERKSEIEELYRARGWGEVSETSYHKFLLYLEKALNNSFFPNQWPEFRIHYTQLEAGEAVSGSIRLFRRLKRGLTIEMPSLQELVQKENLPPIMSDDLLARSLYRMPVHACGYNWLASNKVSAEKQLAKRIDEVIKQYGKKNCRQVILVTHSMGGLVARRCAQLMGMSEKIAGILHGVMPTTGAAIAYRRCKLGLSEEGFWLGRVVGSNGREVSAVFAQAPGALEMLPTQQYGTRWLQLYDENGKEISSWPVKDPYEEIYLRKDRWWGLMREEWLSPTGGTPITWDDFARNIREARDFHKALDSSYCSMTYVFYGTKERSFDRITWDMRRGISYGGFPEGTPPDALQVSKMEMQEVRDDGTNPLYVGGKTVAIKDNNSSKSPPSTTETSHWELRCRMQDGDGDGTVPERSGWMPLLQARKEEVRYQFKLSGFEHEKPYLDSCVQTVTLYCLVKIAAQARRPSCIA